MTDFFGSISWREPLWLLLALQPFVMQFLVFMTRKFQQESFADQNLLPWIKLEGINITNKHYFKKILLLLAWCAFAISMAGPRIANKIVSTNESSYASILVLLDVSRSMTAHDMQPSRLERAKLELFELVQRAKYQRIGIMLFAGKSHLLNPPTSDTKLLRHYISAISPSILPSRGSNLENALQHALQYLEQENNKSRTILLITDGESTSHTISPYEQILAKIKQQNISIYSLAIGTESGSPIPDSTDGWLKHNEQDVITRAQYNLLRILADRTNGGYSKAVDTDNDWRHLYDNGIAKQNIQDILLQKSSELVIWNELYPWFILWGLVFFISANLHIEKLSRRTFFFVLSIPAILLLGFISTSSFANDNYQRAYEAYLQQDYQQAENYFSNVHSYAGQLGLASAAYQAHDYNKAITFFIQASLAAQTDHQRAHALFNLANSYYKIDKYQHAANIYQDVLRYQPGFAPAKTNLSYALSLIKQQKTPEKPVSVQRGGKGPGTARLDDNAEPGRVNLTLDNESDSEPYGLSNGMLTRDKQQSTDLSSAGLVTQDIESEEDTAWTYQVNTIEELAIISNNISGSDHIFWQRLFEWEEGFPAPLKEPVTVPGVEPW